MNEVILPEIRDLRKIKKKIGNDAFRQVLKDIGKYLEDGKPDIPMGTRIKDLQNQYLRPEYRLRSGDYRVFYVIEKRMLLAADKVYVIDIIHKKAFDLWLKTYGVQK